MLHKYASGCIIISFVGGAIMINVGIIGATGYTGSELIRLLLGHGGVNLAAIGARSTSGAVSDLHKSVLKLTDAKFCDLDISNYKECDVVFLALPHGTSSEYAKNLIDLGIKVIDLGADFRLNDPVVYEEWYGADHACPDWMSKTVYGLPELHRERIRNSNLVANPGCFPTSIILGLAPLCKEKLLNPSLVVADSDSGLTGAGKSLKETSHFVNVNENVVAYNIGKHRHLPEIVQELNELYGDQVGLVFNPHLAPINRGILSTLTVRLNHVCTIEQINEMYHAFYDQEPFVRVRPLGEYAATKQVMGSNFCDLSLHHVNDTTLVICAAIDNIVKGASGQAVQNMNILCGFPETQGLEQFPLCP